MPDAHRLTRLRSPRFVRRTTAALALLLPLAGCSQYYPNSTLTPHSEFGRLIDHLWHIELNLGTAVFIVVEGLLVYTLFRYRERPGQPSPEAVHGNTTLEILWTGIPIIVLLFIAIPTIRTIFETQRKAPANSLEVDVYGHQWWWEFQYPQYHVTTANELYLPLGRPVNFVLRSKDVLHSFWIPELGGKRDLITNHTNYLWFTPDSGMAPSAWNGECAEYCGTSHGVMHFRVFTVAPADFARWAAYQANPSHPDSASGITADTGGYRFPAAQLPSYVIPATPAPANLSFATGVAGDPARGRKLYSSSACIGCHMVRGNPMSVGIIGPDLTHIASRYTIGAGRYPNDATHLRLWIKNARLMKPGVIMPTLGANQVDPTTSSRVPAAAGLTDQQIADIVAYLQQLR
jgi:cytochrome c oxidase subunit 2